MVDQLVHNSDGSNFFDISPLMSENDPTVDSFASGKQRRLLTSCLYSNLKESTFIAASNIGIYHTAEQPAIVPDVFVSFDLSDPSQWWKKPERRYLVWEFGKPPELVIEIVTDMLGDELTAKLEAYRRMRVSYYLVYDPSMQLSGTVLRLYELQGMRYVELEQAWLEQLQLGLIAWQGEFEGRQDIWLRWQNADGSILLTGDEKAQQEGRRADSEWQRAEQERQRADRLAAFLRSQGIDPDRLPDESMPEAVHEAYGMS